MKIYTVANGKVFEGADVGSYTLEGAGITIPAILVGEKGRGRSLGVLPVEFLLPEQREEWQQKGSVKVYSAKISQTKSGKPKLIATVDSEDEGEKILCILRTHIGYRGSNSHTGDCVDEYWTLSPVYRESAQRAGIPLKDRYSSEEVREYTPALMREFAKRIGCSSSDVSAGDTLFERKINFAPFPGEILSEGIIAQGDAGAMGSGKQIIAIIPKGVVFRTGYKGRLYGAPSEHYYIYKDGKLLSSTWEEREITDIF